MGGVLTLNCLLGRESIEFDRSFNQPGGTMGGILGIVVLVLDIFAILDVMKGSKPTGQKILWVVLILILPVIGLIAYYVVGKK